MQNENPKSSYPPQIPQQEPSRRFERLVRGFGPYRMNGPLTPYYSDYLTNQYQGQELPKYVLNKILRNTGKGYYQKYFSQQPFQQFLSSNRGTRFLGTTSQGTQFLGTQPGLNFLLTDQGKEFLNSYPGQEYLKNQIKSDDNISILRILKSINYFNTYYGKLLLCDIEISNVVSRFRYLSLNFFLELIFNANTIQEYFNKFNNTSGIDKLINNLNDFQNKFNNLRKYQYNNPKTKAQQIIDAYFDFFKSLMDEICEFYPEPREYKNTSNPNALINLINNSYSNQNLILDKINYLNTTLLNENKKLHNIVQKIYMGQPTGYGASGGKRTFYFEHGGKQSKIKAEKPKKAAEKVYKKTKAEKITVKDKKTGKKYHYTLEKNGELKNKK